MEEQLENRRSQMKDIVRTAEEMMETASAEERVKLAGQIKDVQSTFEKIRAKCDNKSRRLEDALREVSQLFRDTKKLSIL